MADPVLHSRPSPPSTACAVCGDPLPAGRALTPLVNGDGYTCSALCAFRDPTGTTPEQRITSLRQAIEDDAEVTATLTVDMDGDGDTTTTITGELCSYLPEATIVLGLFRDARGEEWEDPMIEWARVRDARESTGR